MTRALCRGTIPRLRAFGATLGVAIAFLVPVRVGATLEADPQVLYQQMKDAYAKAQASGWGYADQLYYLSMIFDAGRAYSLQRPDDPTYGEIATLAVQMGAALHYDPLTNHDAATWYVREAALWVEKNSSDPTLKQDAQQLFERTDAEDGDPEVLANDADQDADALAHDFPHDVQADTLPLEADWRAWELTHDPAWRSKALARAAEPSFPIAHLSYVYGGAFVDAVENALSNVPGFTAQDRVNAKIVYARLKSVGELQVIAHVKALPPDVYMTTLAPADEYFGSLKMSILGIENEMKHVNFMLDYKYGNLESGDAVQVANSIEDMQRVYPRDRDMTELLYACIQMLDRMTSPQAQDASKRLRGILTVEYEDSPEAQKLLGLDPPSQ